MNVFWDSKKALSQAQVIGKAEEDGNLNWKKQTIFSLINSLLDKGLIQMEGSVRSGKTYARTFAATPPGVLRQDGGAYPQRQRNCGVQTDAET